MYTALKTNGYINLEPLKELSPFIDVMNIDIKGFTDKFYQEICGAHLDSVLKTCELVLNLNIHLELTYLVIPTLNDSHDEIEQFCQWVYDSLHSNVPIHFIRFEPDYKLKHIPKTSLKLLNKVHDIAKSTKLNNVYVEKSIY